MQYNEFKRYLGKAGLTVREFAALMGINNNSVSNYAAADKVPSHHAVAVALMGAMAENRIDFRAVVRGIDVQPKRVRGAAAIGRFASSKQTDLPM
jgi:transcriptional regulator with XRE-family HTH domain